MVRITADERAWSRQRGTANGSAGCARWTFAVAPAPDGVIRAMCDPYLLRDLNITKQPGLVC